MQTMHNTLIFYVQVPVPCISSLIDFFFILYVWVFFYHFLGFIFEVNSGVFFITE